jgi:hypothetical protein
MCPWMDDDSQAGGNRQFEVKCLCFSDLHALSFGGGQARTHELQGFSKGKDVFRRLALEPLRQLLTFGLK